MACHALINRAIECLEPCKIFLKVAFFLFGEGDKFERLEFERLEFERLEFEGTTTGPIASSVG